MKLDQNDHLVSWALCPSVLKILQKLRIFSIKSIFQHVSNFFWLRPYTSDGLVVCTRRLVPDIYKHGLYTGSTITNWCFLFCSCIHIHRPMLLFRHLFFPAPMYNFGYLCKITEFWLYIPIWGTFGSSLIFTILPNFHGMTDRKNVFFWNFW